MGQGTHQFASVQLARYVTALANRGTVYDLSLIDKETDSQGNLVKDYSPAVASTLDFQTSTWDAVQQGMRQVVTNSSTKRVFDGLDVHVPVRPVLRRSPRNEATTRSLFRLHRMRIQKFR